MWHPYSDSSYSQLAGTPKSLCFLPFLPLIDFYPVARQFIRLRFSTAREINTYPKTERSALLSATLLNAASHSMVNTAICSPDLIHSQC